MVWMGLGVTLAPLLPVLPPLPLFQLETLCSGSMTMTSGRIATTPNGAVTDEGRLWGSFGNSKSSGHPCLSRSQSEDQKQGTLTHCWAHVMVFSHPGSQQRSLWGHVVFQVFGSGTDRERSQCQPHSLGGQRHLRGDRTQPPASSGKHTTYNREWTEMVVSNSESFWRRRGLEIAMPTRYWMLLSLEPPPSQATPFTFPLIWGHTFKRRLPVLPLHTARAIRENDGPSQGSSSLERTCLLCIKFLFSYSLHFPPPLVISNERIQSWIDFSTQSKLSFPLFFLKKKENDAFVISQPQRHQPSLKENMPATYNKTPHTWERIHSSCGWVTPDSPRCCWKLAVFPCTPISSSIWLTILF